MLLRLPPARRACVTRRRWARHQGRTGTCKSLEVPLRSLGDGWMEPIVINDWVVHQLPISVINTSLSEACAQTALTCGRAHACTTLLLFQRYCFGNFFLLAVLLFRHCTWNLKDGKANE